MSSRRRRVVAINVSAGGVLVDFLEHHYLSIKALHLIFVISWMAGLLYLPRLFVYHRDARVHSSASETLKVMEHRLSRYIMTPAMIGASFFGGLLMGVPGVLSPPRGWFHGKLVCLLGLFLFHGILMRWKKAFSRDERPQSAIFFKVANEIPTLLMILIVFFVVTRPF